MPKVQRVAVLGSRPGSGNIGDWSAKFLRKDGIIVHEDDCAIWEAEFPSYETPTYDLGQYDGLVVTLGFTQLTAIREARSDQIRDVIYGSLILPLDCVRKYVQDRGRDGRIILIGSYAHNHPLTNCAAYCAAKAGLAAAVQELGWELTPDFITHIIHPYHVPSTPMGKHVVESMMKEREMSRDEAVAYQKKDLKMERHLKPQDVARTVTWLLTHPTTASWLSGQGLNLYGGTR